MLGVGALASAVVMGPVLNLLLKAYGMGPATADHPQSLQAAQATLMESVSRGMFGGHLPWDMVMAGMGIGAVIIIVDEILKAGKSGVRAPVLAAAVGIYLPLELEVPIFIGGLLAYFAEKRLTAGIGLFGATKEDVERLARRGMLFAAGLITGEALVGVLIAIPIVTLGRDDVFALPEALRFGGWLGLLMLAGIAVLMFRVGTRPDAGSPEAQPLRR
jgi:putative OPT family oligopeptide transporter